MRKPFVGQSTEASVNFCWTEPSEWTMGDGLQKDIPSFNSYHILFYNFFPDPASLFVLLREMLKQFVYSHFYVPPPGN